MCWYLPLCFYIYLYSFLCPFLFYVLKSDSGKSTEGSRLAACLSLTCFFVFNKGSIKGTNVSNFVCVYVCFILYLCLNWFFSLYIYFCFYIYISTDFGNLTSTSHVCEKFCNNFLLLTVFDCHEVTLRSTWCFDPVTVWNWSKQLNRAPVREGVHSLLHYFPVSHPSPLLLHSFPVSHLSPLLLHSFPVSHPSPPVTLFLWVIRLLFPCESPISSVTLSLWVTHLLFCYTLPVSHASLSLWVTHLLFCQTLSLWVAHLLLC